MQNINKSIPKINIEVTYPILLCFRFRIIRMNGKILVGESFDISLPYLKYWLNNAKNKFLQAIKRGGRGVGEMVIKLPGILNDSIIPYDEYEEEDEEYEEEIEIIRI